jgi:hypothetical protein
MTDELKSSALAPGIFRARMLKSAAIKTGGEAGPHGGVAITAGPLKGHPSAAHHQALAPSDTLIGESLRASHR